MADNRPGVLIFVKNREILEATVASVKSGTVLAGCRRETYAQIQECLVRGGVPYLSFLDAYDALISNIEVWNALDGASSKRVELAKLHEITQGVIFRLIGSLEAQRDAVRQFMEDCAEKYKGTMINPPQTVIYGSSKDYIGHLAEGGFSVPATHYFPPSVRLSELLGTIRAAPSLPYVIKPLTGEVSNSVAILQEIDEDFLRRKEGKVGGWMIQPLIPEIWNGENQLVYIGGKFSHAFAKRYVKTAKSGLVPTRVDLDNTRYTEYRPTNEEFDLAERVYRYLKDTKGVSPLVTRIDYLTTATGQPMIMEVEMVNPEIVADECQDKERARQIYARVFDIFEPIGLTKRTKAMNTATDFESGSGTNASYDSDSRTLAFDLVKNGAGKTNHWFHLRFSDDNMPERLKIVVRNARDSIFAHGWQGYRPYINDGGAWRRTDAAFSFDGQEATLELDKPPQDFRFAWYQPYPLASIQSQVEKIGQTGKCVSKKAEGIDIIDAGNPQAPTILVVGRQHPGESMASFFMEGFLKELFADTPESATALDKHNFVIIPAMNPAGIRDGFHRTDKDGNDYNLCWTRNDIPAIEAVKAHLVQKPRVAALLDIHGDEVSKLNYIFHNPRYSKKGRNSRLFDQLCGPQQPMQPVEMPSDLKWMLRELIKKGRLSIPVTETAGHFERQSGCLALVYELNSHVSEPADHRELGRGLVKQLAGM